MFDHLPSDENFWQENESFFQQHDPALLEEVEQIQQPEHTSFGRAKDNLPVLSWQNNWIDPPDAPQQQALQIVGPQQQPIHVHIGLGLGYYLEVDQASEDTTTIVYEPQPEIIAAALNLRPLAKICQRKETFITCSFQRLEKLLLTHMTFGKGVKIVVSPAHERLFPEQLQYFREVFNKVHEIRRLARGMFGEAVAGTWAATFKALPLTTQLPGAEQLRDKLKNCPTVILSAGPSLEGQLPLLRSMQDHICIIAISRTAHILDRYGIAPDFLVHTESQDYFHLIRNCSNLAKTTFLLADQTQLQYFQFPHQQTMVYQSSLNPVTQWSVAQEPQLRKLETLNSGSVSSVAFHLAVEMGCNPIIILGQDLAFKADQLYVDGGSADDIFSERRHREVPGVFDQKLRTSNNYLVTVYWYEKVVPQFRKRFPNLKLYNATESGAQIPHFEHRPLRHLLHQFAAKPLAIKQAMPQPQTQPAMTLEQMAEHFDALGKSLDFVAKHAKQFEAFERPFLKKLAKAKKPKDYQNLQNQMKKLDAINNSLFTHFDNNPGLPGFFQAYIESFRKLQQIIQQRSKGAQNPVAWVSYMKANLKDLALFHKQVQSHAHYIYTLLELGQTSLASVSSASKP